MADVIFNSFLEYVATGVIDLLNNEIKCAILDNGYTPNRDLDDNFGDVSAHEVTGEGYAAGGQVLANKTLVHDDTDDLAKFDADNPVWNPVTFTNGRWAILYKNAVAEADKKLIGAWNFGSNISPTGNMFTAIINDDGFLNLINGILPVQNGGTGQSSLSSVDHGSFGNLGDDDHPQYIKHALATAANDFLVASGSGAFVKKTLAETQAILGAPKRIIQVVNYQTGAVATGTTLIHLDDTIPQNTEGDQFMTLGITPTNVNNKLKIDIVAILSHNYAGVGLAVIGALFQDAGANALAAAYFASDGGYPMTVAFSHYMIAGTISPTTFKFRAGTNAGSPYILTFNGVNGLRNFGGVMASSITITEIAA